MKKQYIIIYIEYHTAVGNIRQWSKDWSSYLERWNYELINIILLL